MASSPLATTWSLPFHTGSPQSLALGRRRAVTMARERGRRGSSHGLATHLWPAALARGGSLNTKTSLTVHNVCSMASGSMAKE